MKLNKDGQALMAKEPGNEGIVAQEVGPEPSRVQCVHLGIGHPCSRVLASASLPVCTVMWRCAFGDDVVEEASEGLELLLPRTVYLHLVAWRRAQGQSQGKARQVQVGLLRLCLEHVRHRYLIVVMPVFRR